MEPCILANFDEHSMVYNKRTVGVVGKSVSFNGYSAQTYYLYRLLWRYFPARYSRSSMCDLQASYMHCQSHQVYKH